MSALRVIKLIRADILAPYFNHNHYCKLKFDCIPVIGGFVPGVKGVPEPLIVPYTPVSVGHCGIKQHSGSLWSGINVHPAFC